ncbi:MAG: undecaprenyl/decaprenyl-phosphate alpha-N-acetylglucosaminyl 1-phosphate transferase [Chloroflexota bacterium]|nr:undecaprenyl/decaprenyl-phosphate alpha-N-acetylglucosaminyl 1-phosphate transferase [Chloroflexota bacterium]
MPHALIAAIVGLLAAAVAAVTIPPIRDIARRLQLLDQPEARRVHTIPIPRIGGLGIYFGFLVAVGVSFMLPVERFGVEIERILLLLIGATMIVGVMLFDDILGIPPLPKLGVQFAAAGVVVLPRLRGDTHGIVIEQFNAPYVGTVTLPLLVALSFTVFWIVGMMNAINWSDGIDGLAASITLVATIVLFLHTYFRPSGDPQFTISLLAIALAGSIVGFLLYNWHPASIIMGDSGAMFLGFALATISMIGGAKIATAMLALGIPILDTAWVILYRVMHGRSPLNADRGHLHHRLLDAGWSQRQIVAGVAGVTALFGALSLALPTREAKLGAMIAMELVLLALIAWLARRGQSRSAPVRYPHADL